MGAEARVEAEVEAEEEVGEKWNCRELGSGGTGPSGPSDLLVLDLGPLDLRTLIYT
jgi:hypothetical protein